MNEWLIERTFRSALNVGERIFSGKNSSQFSPSPRQIGLFDPKSHVDVAVRRGNFIGSPSQPIESFDSSKSNKTNFSFCFLSNRSENKPTDERSSRWKWSRCVTSIVGKSNVRQGFVLVNYLGQQCDGGQFSFSPLLRSRSFIHSFRCVVLVTCWHELKRSNRRRKQLQLTRCSDVATHFYSSARWALIVENPYPNAHPNTSFSFIPAITRSARGRSSTPRRFDLHVRPSNARTSKCERREKKEILSRLDYCIS